MPKYNEILRLKQMLEEANIPFEFTDDFFKSKGSDRTDLFGNKFYPAYQIRLNKNLDVIEHCGSYGQEEDLLEIMGGLTKEEQDMGVLGHLTAEEVFKRFKYCYEHNTSVYVDELYEKEKKEKQIEELSKEICNGCKTHHKCQNNDGFCIMSDVVAEWLFNKGYRKTVEQEQ